jgi:hypothetical protein
LRAPTAIKGRRTQEIWKGRGDNLDNLKSRGVLIQSHLGKVHGSLLKDGLGDPYPMPAPSMMLNVVAFLPCLAQLLA